LMRAMDTPWTVALYNIGGLISMPVDMAQHWIWGAASKKATHCMMWWVWHWSNRAGFGVVIGCVTNMLNCSEVHGWCRES
jgi:hypothetical protein